MLPWQHRIQRWYDQLILYSGPPDTLSYHFDNTVYILATVCTPWQHCIHRWYDELILYSCTPDTYSYQLDNTAYTGGMTNWLYILVHLRHWHSTLTTLYTPLVWWTFSIFCSTWYIVIPPWQHRIDLDNTVYTLATLYTPVVWWTDSMFWSTWHIVIRPWQHCINLDNAVHTGGLMNWFYIRFHLTHCHTSSATPSTLDNVVYTLTTLYTPLIWRTDSISWATWHIGIAAWQHCIHRWCDELILYSGPPKTLSYNVDNTVYSGGMMNWFYILVHLTHFHTTLTTLYTPVVWWTDCIFWSTWDIGIAPWQPGIHRWCDEHILHSAPPDTLSYHLDNTV